MTLLAQIVFLLAAAASLLPSVSAGVALLAGMILAVTLGNPFLDRTRKWTSNLLQLSVMGLGAGMDLGVVVRAGSQGIGYTAIGITFTLLLGAALGKLLKTDKDTSILVSSGTAICGGSAIAAIASTIQANPAEVSVALATVFFLNATALFIFPWIGHHLALDQTQFGLWSALAIHDTSSVVGASLQYGTKAMEVATTVKLARALWIIPVTFGIGAFRKSAKKGKAKKPWFILGFVLAAAIVTFIPQLQPTGHWVSEAAKHGLVFTLFLIGSGLTRATLRSVGARPFLQGLLLWIIVGSATLAAICAGWIH